MNPALDDAGQRILRRLREAEIEGHVELVGALPIGLGVLLGHDVQVVTSRIGPGLGEQGAEPAHAAGSEYISTTSASAASAGRRWWLPSARERTFRGARHEGVLFAGKHVRADQVDELVDEHRRYPLSAWRKQSHVARLQRPMLQQVEMR